MAALDSWLPMAQAAGYAVSHVPLSDASRAAWNQSAAEAYIFDTLGLPYGYHNFIMTFFGMCCAWRIRAELSCALASTSCCARRLLLWYVRCVRVMLSSLFANAADTPDGNLPCLPLGS